MKVREKKAEIEGREVDGCQSRVCRITHENVKGKSKQGDERQPCVSGTGAAAIPWCLDLSFAHC